MRVAKVLAVCCKNLFKLLIVHSLQLWVSLILSSSIIFVCWPTPPANSHQLSSSFNRALIVSSLVLPGDFSLSSLPSSIKTHGAISKEKLDKGHVYVGKRYHGQLENISTSLQVNLAFFQK